jgi:addiction module HigA family antidote
VLLSLIVHLPQEQRLDSLSRHVCHSSEILREEFLAPLGLSAHALAMELKVPVPRINDIVRERRAVTPDTALRLSRYFGTTAQFWLNLQTSYDLKIAKKAVGSK